MYLGIRKRKGAAEAAQAEHAAAAGSDETEEAADSPAVRAERSEQSARDSRELAARARAECEAEIRRLTKEAETEIRRLEDSAADADSDAAFWREQERLDAEIARSAAELRERQAMLAALGAEAAQLEQAVRQDREQLAQLAETRQDAEERLTGARSARDVAAIATALGDLQAVGMVEADVSAELDRAAIRLGVLQGGAGAIAQASKDFGRMALRLDELHREHDGLPSRQEIYAVALGLLPQLVGQMMVDDPVKLCAIMLVTAAASDAAAAPDGRGSGSSVAAVRELAEMVKKNPAAAVGTFLMVANALAQPALLPEVVAQIEAAAAGNTGQYEELRRAAFAKPSAADPEPAQPGPEFAVLPDNGLRYLGPLKGA